ncbi:porin family protein [Halorhodospira halochloris]|uniref:porin family protein n=1 Tax=Halorhodospira halochloris TaxID=1052 RepID=UPI001EE8EAB4|nr:porin family protein [Halorhodospira halochloris]MCG5531388.1 porin family protein [Halorhodospira halochloris]
MGGSLSSMTKTARRGRHISQICTSLLWPSLAVACFVLAGVNSAHAQWGQQGEERGDTLLEQLDIYIGAEVGRWSFELDEENSNGQTYESEGGTFIFGIQLIEQFLSIEQRFTYGGSDSNGFEEVKLEGAWSTAFRFSLNLTTWNDIYALFGLSSYHFTTEKNGETSDEVDLTNHAAGLGLTHRVSKRAWLYAERFFYDGIDGDFRSEVSGGALYRF